MFDKEYFKVEKIKTFVFVLKTETGSMSKYMWTSLKRFPGKRNVSFQFWEIMCIEKRIFIEPNHGNQKKWQMLVSNKWGTGL